MTRQEHLLTVAMEECAELAQRLSKMLRFGAQEVQPVETGGDGRTNNVERAREEFNDLKAVMAMVDESFGHETLLDQDQMAAKMSKVEHFLQYAERCGTVNGRGR